jgi:hypothetical protein
MQSIAIGDRYGKLVILGRGGLNERKNRLWTCLCDCGNTASIRTSDLRQGRRRSCGCLRQDVLKGRRKKTGHSEALDRFLSPGREILT